ncbi:flagellar basal body L-ring protein FlgH [Pedomonas sp. V897]|uniref:flagellar basal body L-ring protein FlgH n=1 Tax=Pedomonas sp. V897 TaxID=3446482 RepID=UPI003EE0D4A9
MWTRLIAIGLAATSLAACGTAERVANIGRAPRLSPIEGVTAPQMQPSLASQQQMAALSSADPAALHGAEQGADASLWRTGSRAFFRDPRASKVGDILTVKIGISDQAQVNNTTSRSRSNSENASIPGLFGLQKHLPGDGSDLVDAGSTSSSSGSGQVNRKETINLTIAAIVTGVLPNGNLVIQGKQEVRVNYEVRELVIAGIVRPEDISRANTIDHTQIAEARISYGGRGQLTDVQQARYGQQLYDALFPF